jgi:glycosyltransferase involved in cell wall biosynthesis
MIVICTHKNKPVLERLLSSIKQHTVEDHKILVVETSENTDSKQLVEEYNGIFINSTVRLYEAGAYITAMQKYPNESEYFMFQDTLEIVYRGWEEMFRAPSMGTKLVALQKIKLWDDPGTTPERLAQGIGCGYHYFKDTFGAEWDEKAFGVMYNTFYLPHSAVKHFFDFGIEKLFVYEKNQSSESERFWGLIACKTCGYDSTESYTGSELGFEKYILKHFQYRK